MTPAEVLIEHIKANNMELFRNCYSSLSFAEVVKIYEGITPHFGEQRHFNFKQVKRAANEVGLSGVVVELGSHDGDLARNMLHHFPGITEWIGYDVCEAGTFLNHSRFKQEILTDWFHKSVPLDGVDAFVSTHTLEHMDRNAVYSTLGLLAEYEIEKVVLEIPFRKRGDWKGSGSAHVLKAFPEDITKALEQLGYQIMHHRNVANNHTWGAIR